MAAARERLGLSPNALASRLTASRMTIVSIEEGGDALASTYVRSLAELTDLLPTDVLGHVGRAPSTFDAAWLLDRRLHGASARRGTRHVRVAEDGTLESSWLVEDARLEQGAPGDEAHVTELLRALLVGGSPVLSLAGSLARALVREAEAPAVVEGGARHVVSWAPGSRLVLRYEVVDPRRRVDLGALQVDTAGGCVQLGSFAVAQIPLERLVLRLDPPPGLGAHEAAPLAWLSPLQPEAGAPGLSGILRPPSTRLSRTRDGAHVLVVDRPPVGLVVGLGWKSVIAPKRNRRGGAGRPVAATHGLGERLRTAREASGLSVRALAQRMGVGAMTVSDAEHGRDPRVSTLRALLDALESASPWDVLCPPSLSPIQGWAFRRDLFGCEVDVETKLVEITAEGDAAMRIETKGLRLVARRPGPLLVRMGFSVPTVVPTRASLRGVRLPRASEDVVRITSATSELDQRLHQLVVPEALARAGVTFTRELLHRAVYALTAERARVRTGTDGPFSEGTSFAAVLPVRRLRIVVRFPLGFVPDEVTSHAWPMSSAPDPAITGLAGWLHPDGLEVVTNRRRREVALTVDRPLIGAKYGLGWALR